MAVPKEAAERDVRTLTGVIGVSNRIKITPGVAAKPAPDEVKDTIDAALKRSAEIDARGLTVEVHNGTVELRGQVGS